MENELPIDYAKEFDQEYDKDMINMILKGVKYKEREDNKIYLKLFDQIKKRMEEIKKRDKLQNSIDLHHNQLLYLYKEGYWIPEEFRKHLVLHDRK